MRPRLDDLLENSVYHPFCGTRGLPVKVLGGNALSFVYVDTSERVLRKAADLLHLPPRGGDWHRKHFLGHGLVDLRELPPQW
ncbi:hypothetical protein JXD38_06640 [candidate division WOR-3 bacterium]|nr:hypothetical protein [candidate division WOR-3 bacterium]